MAASPKMILGWIMILLIFSSAVMALKTFRVQETDLVMIRPEAIDADNDQIAYHYSAPLDEQGEWQTGYDDAGEYLVEITASDGINQTTQRVLLIVENKNRVPVLLEQSLTVKETQEVDLSSLVEDPDRDLLIFTFAPPFDRQGKWQTGYDDAGDQVIAFGVNDGEATESFRVLVQVLNTNQPPEITTSFSDEQIIFADENEVLSFWVEVKDSDDDALTFQWKWDGKNIAAERTGEYYIDYASAGDHNVTVIVSDGTGTKQQTWTVKVTNVNRQPELVVLPLTFEEGDVVKIELPKTDIDGEVMYYSFSDPLDEAGSWQTDYDDAGEYDLKITGSDGELTDSVTTTLTILDVDQAPVLNVPLVVEARENEEMSWIIDSYDLDGDKVTISFENFPTGAVFDQNNKTLTWTPGYDAIKRRGGVFSDILNALRLEHFFLRQGTNSLKVTSCGKDLCTSERVALMVYNTNRAPQLEPIPDIYATETDKITLIATATDADQDIIRYYFTSPLKTRSGSWETGYDDAGDYIVYVTATDGDAGETVPVTIHLENKNRAPSLKTRKDKLVVNEGQEFTVHFTATDPDEQNLSLYLRHPPAKAALQEGTLVWTPDHNTVVNKTDSRWNSFISKFAYMNQKFSKEQATVWLEFAVSDGEMEVVHPVQVVVKNVNQPPEITESKPAAEITVKANQPVLFNVVAKDEDKDTIHYSWYFGDETITGSDTVRRTFVSPGRKTVRVTVSDGRDSVEQEWKVVVEGEPITEEAVVPAAPVPPASPPTFDVYIIRS